MASVAEYSRPVEVAQVAEPHARVIEIAPGPQKEPARWRLVRVLIAVPLIVLSGGALFPFAVVPVSTQAVVNARLSEVRSPIQGNIEEIRFETGDIVSANEPLAKIRAGSENALSSQKDRDNRMSNLQAQAGEIDSELAADQQEVSQSNEMAASYAKHLLTNLQFQLQTAQKEQAAAQSKQALADQEVTRETHAAQDHLIARSVLEEAMEQDARAQQEAQAASTSTLRIQNQIADVRNGYLMGVESQPPAFIQQRNAATTEIARLNEEKQSIAEQTAALQKGKNPSQAQPALVVVRSAVTGPIWSRSASPTQRVNEDDALYRVADVSSIHVEVWLDRRYGPQLSIGDVALVYLSGLGKELTGHVVSFQGSSRRRLDEEINAIDLQPVHPDQYHVTIELDPADRKSIYIGQAAKVIFPGSKGEMKARVISWLTQL